MNSSSMNNVAGIASNNALSNGSRALEVGAAALIVGPPRLRPHWPIRPLRSALGPLRGRNSRRGVVTRAAGEGPRDAGIDGQCESAHEADSYCNDSRRRSKE